MAGGSYDVITVGGGLGGAAFAKRMAEHGARILVLERERQCKDRVRGEYLAPWGVAEARMLGLYDVLRDTCGHALLWIETYVDSRPPRRRHLPSSTPHQVPAMGLYRPAMQEVALQAAEAAGAEVQRGASVRSVRPGQVPSVVIDHNGHHTELRARLVVGADGRTSMVRQWASLPVRHDPERLYIAGVLLEEMSTQSEDTSSIAYNTALGLEALLFPQGQGRVRAYLVYNKDAPYRLHGTTHLTGFVEASIRAGLPAAWYAGTQPLGPLASFRGAATWVEYPYRDGVVLVGDAAGASDPTWGQGLSLTLRDTRILCEQLLRHDDWEEAGQAYAREHNRYFGVVHTAEEWLTAMFHETGPVADARRDKALPLIAQDPTRRPDVTASGPDCLLDETARRRFFGED
ncbi:MAG TPA: FAD-dependent monooxygenase [Candidatus Tectomicrobia bacterium]